MGQKDLTVLFRHLEIRLKPCHNTITAMQTEAMCDDSGRAACKGSSEGGGKHAWKGVKQDQDTEKRKQKREMEE